MVDTFISYSRKDIAFAKIVHESLQSNDIETWIDWQDIPPSVDWIEEIKEAIEQSDTFIFIISPTSIQSEICSKEIAHAEANNKRLIPIVIGDFAPEDVPSTLIPLNWIFFKEDDTEYQQAMEALLYAIQLDQAWLKTHTRLQNKALEWERNEQKNGYLLHGDDLIEAEKWLGMAASKEPEPTAVQTQYILASRAQATRRQRQILTGVAVAFVVALALGILALVQRNLAVSESEMRATAQMEAVEEANLRATAQIKAEDAEATAVVEAITRATQQKIAEDQKEIAEEQRNIAEAKGLASSAISLINTEIDLASLLAVEGLYKEVNYDTKNAMVRALTAQQYRLKTIQLEEDGSVLSIDINSDMSLIAALTISSKVYVFDPVSGVHEYPPLELEEVRILDVAFSPDDSLLACAAEDGVVYLFDVESGIQLDYHFEPPNVNYGGIDQIRFIDDDNAVGLADNISANVLIFWNVEDGSIQKIIRNMDGSFSDFTTDLKISEDGTLVAINGERTIYIYDVETKELYTDPIETGTLIQTIAISPDKTKIAAGSLNLGIWEIETGENIGSKWDANDGAINQLLFIDESYLIAAGLDYLKIWRTQEHTLAATWIFDGHRTMGRFATNHLQISPDGQLIIAGEAHGKVSFFGIFSDIPGRIPFEYENFTMTSMVFSENTGEIFASASYYKVEEDLIISWDQTTGELTGEPIHVGSGSISPLQLSPDGQLIAFNNRDYIYFYDVEKREKLDLVMSIKDERITDFKFLNNSTYIVLVTIEGNLYLFDYKTGEQLLRKGIEFQSEFLSVGELFIDKSDNRIILDIQFEKIIVFDANTLERITEIPKDQVNNLAPTDISADGKYLIGFGGGDLILLDTTTLEVEAQIQGILTDTIFPNAIFSPDGSMVAGYFEGGFQFFEVPTLSPIGDLISGNFRHLNVKLANTHPLLSYDGPFYPGGPMTFSPDGSYLLLGGRDNLRMVYANIEDWIKQACFRAGRNLTTDEWGSYLQFDEYRETCP